MRELPFKGFSWQISQHEKAFSEKITFDLLACAQQFEGASGYTDELNSLLVHEGLLTDNVRDGKASPWRDYQQVLPEIGLIHSTKVARSIRLTPLGYSFLSGNLNYEEILTLQLFKYQYPNGQKFQLGPKIQAAWPSNESVPGSLIEACVRKGISIRPALTLALVLCELNSKGVQEISLEQVLAFVLPNTSDAETYTSVREILDNAVPSDVNQHARRNVAAWLRLCGQTKIFSRNARGSLSLSSFALERFDRLKTVLEDLRDVVFWEPELRDKDRSNWFDTFGNRAESYSAFENLIIEPASLRAGQILMPAVEPTPIGSIDPGSLELSDFVDLPEEIKTPDVRAGSEFAQSVVSGNYKRAVATAMHDRIVNQIAGTLVKRGAKVLQDRRSVDLLAIFPNGSEEIYEIKTTNSSNLSHQLRSGFAQVLEYRYRRQKEIGSNATCYLAIDRPVVDDWQKEFMFHHGVRLVGAENFTPL